MRVILKTPSSHRFFMFYKDVAPMLKAMETNCNNSGALFPKAIAGALEALKKSD